MTRTLSTRSAPPPRSSSSVDLVPPKYLWIPDYDLTLGPEVAAIATLAGFPPDPEQQLLLDAAFALDAERKSVAGEVVVIAPRQNLKTGLFKQIALGDLFVRNERLVVWSAHEFDTSQEALNDIEALIDGSDMLRRRIKRIVHGAVPVIELLPKFGGGRLKFKTRTSGGGRGLSGRKVFLDEGYALQAGQMGALLPIMLAQPDPQVRVGSSACRPESAVLWDFVQRGRAGGDPRMVYAEWCAPPPEEACDAGAKCDHTRGRPGCGCDDLDLIRGVHSAITRGRILVKTVLDMRKMPPSEYGREIMGWHDEPVAGPVAIPAAAWHDRSGADGRPDGPVAFALSAAWPDAEVGSIAIVGRHRGEVYAQVVEHRPGTSWMPERMRELAEKHKPLAVVLDDKDPAACEKTALTASLAEIGLELTSLSTTEATQAFGMLIAAVMGDAPYLRHYDQAELNDAVESAYKREVGDAHTWTRKGPNDISPIVAVTHAAYGLLTAKPLEPMFAWA
jgi:hypothetical protein